MILCVRDRRRILVVDDDAAARDQPPDLVVLDPMLTARDAVSDPVDPRRAQRKKGPPGG